MAFKEGPVADDDGGQHQRKDAQRNQEVDFFARPFPFVQNPAPHRAEDDDAGHVQGPGGEAVLAHLRFAHGVEEKLKVPERAGKRGKQIISQQGNAEVRLSCGVCLGPRLRSKVLIGGTILDV